MKINVYSEIGKLNKVLLHRPGKELENLTPDLLERLLFDDIPWLEAAQKEHDEFADLLKSKNVEVYYIEKMVAKAIENSDAKEEFLTTFVEEAIDKNAYIINNTEAKKVLRSYLDTIVDNQELVDKTIAGIRVDEVNAEELVNEDYLFIADPLPNLYFQRDPYASIGCGASINTMYSITRNRETLYAHIMLKYYPEFKDENIERVYDRNQEYSIEGGDQLVVSKHTILIGNSQRTEMEAIKKIAKNILSSNNNEIKKIIVFDIGKSRKFMHLDTVFTHVDYDKFTAHPTAINSKMNIKSITMDSSGNLVEETVSNIGLQEILEQVVGRKVTIIECGGGDPIIGAREQWNDGANTLTIAPGEVIVYERNVVTNKKLREAGIIVHEISGAELVRGRGGARCMSMPLDRDDIDL